MSANYFGDLIKRATGDTAGHLIKDHIMRQAKNRLAAGATVSQVAYGLGFDYPQHFSRMFKKVLGVTPREYINGQR